MRELKTDEIENVSGGTGWLDYRVSEGGRNWETGELVIGLADPLGNANTGYLENTQWFTGIYEASDGSLWLDRESARGYETQLEAEAFAEERAEQCEQRAQVNVGTFIGFIDGDLSASDSAAIIIGNEVVDDLYDCD